MPSTLNKSSRVRKMSHSITDPPPGLEVAMSCFFFFFTNSLFALYQSVECFDIPKFYLRFIQSKPIAPIKLLVELSLLNVFMFVMVGQKTVCFLLNPLPTVWNIYIYIVKSVKTFQCEIHNLFTSSAGVSQNVCVCVCVCIHTPFDQTHINFPSPHTSWLSSWNAFLTGRKRWHVVIDLFFI